MRLTKAYYTLFISLFALTLSAQFDAPKIRSINYIVTSDVLEIKWAPSDSPDVDYYEISYYIPTGTIGFSHFGTVSAADSSYIYDPNIESGPDPANEPMMFGIKAHNASTLPLNTLDHLVFDSSIYLQAKTDSCLASVDLNWNSYKFKQWTQPGTSGYRIYVSDNNGLSYNLHETISEKLTNYSIKNLESNKNYRIYISAVSTHNTADFANSNPVTINTDMARLPEYMHANSASYDNGGANTSFSIDPASQTQIYNLLRSIKPDSEFEEIYQFNTSEKELSYTDNTIDYLSSPYYYKIEVINNCDVNIRESENTASTIILANQENPLSPTLNWNEYVEFATGLDAYAIERKFGNTDYTLIATQVENKFIDTEIQDLIEQNYAAKVCYRVTALENGGNNSSLSNDICMDLPVNIRFEFDAFMPGSTTANNTFGPTIDFIPDEYVFKILDRNGRLVFQSKDTENTRWDGYTNGILAQEGVYICIIQYRIGNRKKQSVHAAVVVVR